jgi:hypothetical protein
MQKENYKLRKKDPEYNAYALRRWRKKNPEKFSKQHKRNSKKYREKHIKKCDAGHKLRYAIATGKIKRQPCEICENPKTQGHHEDYDKPLDVRWLCDKHHKEEHKKKK